MLIFLGERKRKFLNRVFGKWKFSSNMSHKSIIMGWEGGRIMLLARQVPYCAL